MTILIITFSIFLVLLAASKELRKFSSNFADKAAKFKSSLENKEEFSEADYLSNKVYEKLDKWNGVLAGIAAMALGVFLIKLFYFLGDILIH